MSEELENKEFDRSVQNKFSEHKTSVPDNLWASIDSKAASLETASLRKRVAWYRWTILSLVVLLGGVVLFYQFEDELSGSKMIAEVETKEQLKTIGNSNTAQSEEVMPVSETEEVKVPSVEQEEQSSTDYVNELENISEEFITADNIAEAKESIPQAQETEPNSISNIVISKDEDSDNPLEESVQVEEVLSNENASLDKKEVEPQEPMIVKEENGNTSSTNEEEKEQENISESFVENKEDETDQKSINENENSVEETKDIITEVVPTDDTKEIVSSVSKSDSTTLDSIVATETASDIPVATPVVEKKALSKITAALFILPNFSYRGFEAASGTHDMYKTNDETKLRLSYGANVGYRISDKVTLRIGVSYHQSKTEIELLDKRPKELPILMDPANSSITIYSSMGTVVANDIGSFSFAGDDEDDEDLDDEDDFASLNFKEEQEFLLLDIPLTVGYEIGKGKLKLLLEGGIVTSILTKAKSKIEIGNVHSPDVLVSIEDYHQTKKMVLGGTIGVGLKYNISRRFSIIGLPTYNTSFMDMNKDSASKMKPNSLNFSLGLQFQF